MRIVVGCDRRNIRDTIGHNDLHNYFRTLGLTDVTFGKLGSTEEEIIKRDPSHLIVWRENNESARAQVEI